jgi:hypothetical protein
MAPIPEERRHRRTRINSPSKLSLTSLELPATAWAATWSTTPATTAREVWSAWAAIPTAARSTAWAAIPSATTRESRSWASPSTASVAVPVVTATTTIAAKGDRALWATSAGSAAPIIAVSKSLFRHESRSENCETEHHELFHSKTPYEIL